MNAPTYICTYTHIYTHLYTFAHVLHNIQAQNFKPIKVKQVSHGRLELD